mgnify:CR=1 FL=1
MFYRGNLPKKDQPELTGSHIQTEVFVMPGNTLEKVGQIGGGNHLRQDVSSC